MSKGKPRQEKRGKKIMKEKQTILKAWKEEVELLQIIIDVPINEYSETLTKLFNNKRDDRDIINLYNYYGNNEIVIEINLTSYCENCYSCENDKNKCIEHIKKWLYSLINSDISKEDFFTNIDTRKCFLYKIDTYENNFKNFDDNGDYIINHIIKEDF